MGLFKSLREISAMGNELQRGLPPVEDRLAGALTTMQESQALMASLTEATTVEAELRAGGNRATATVTAASAGIGMVNMAAVMEVQLLVQVAGRPPAPATVRAAVPMHLQHKVTPGAQVPVLVSPDGTKVAIDSAALSVA